MAEKLVKEKISAYFCRRKQLKKDMGKEERMNSLTLKSLTKSSIWDIQENDVFRLWESAEKDSEVRENIRHYQDIIRSAFMIEEVKDEKTEKPKFEKQGYKVAQVKIDESTKVTWALKKKPIVRVTDLTYENIRHITAAKLVEVLDRNFGGGWDSLSQSIKDIIESGFDISTTTLPKDRLHKKGGMYEKKVADGYDVLEVEKGTWVEAIFAKVKPIVEKPKKKFDPDEEDEVDGSEINEDEDEDVEVEDHYNDIDDDDDDFDEDKLTEESYRTTFETDPDDLSLEAADVSDEDDGY
jgi:hypothetical protein